MSRGRIAITHASSLLAEALLESMTAAGVEPDAVVLLDVADRAGERLAYGGTYLTVQDQYAYDFEDLVAVLLLQQDEQLEDLLQHADCYVVSHHADSGVSREIVKLETGPAGLPGTPCALRVAGGEASTLLQVLVPLQSLAPILGLHVVSVLSADQSGKAAVEELATQTIALLNGREADVSVLPMQLAFNMVPLNSDEDTARMIAAQLESTQLRCMIQRIMVATFHGTAMGVQVEFETAVEMAEVQELLQRSEGIRLLEQPASSLTDCKEGLDAGIFALFQPQKDAKWLQFWIIADSIKNGLVKNYQKVIDLLLNPFL